MDGVLGLECFASKERPSLVDALWEKLALRERNIYNKELLVQNELNSLVLTADKESPMNWNASFEGVNGSSLAPFGTKQISKTDPTRNKKKYPLTPFSSSDSRLTRLFCHPHELMRTTVFPVFELFGSVPSGMAFRPSVRFTVTNSP